MAKGVISESEDAAFFVEGERVIVACRYRGDVETTKGGNFVRLVVGTFGAGGPCKAWDAELAARGKFFTAGGGAEDPAGRSENEEVFKTRGYGGDLLGPGSRGKLDGAVGDGRLGGVEWDPGTFGGLGTDELVGTGDGKRVDFSRRGEGDNPISRDGDGYKVFASQCRRWLGDFFRICSPPL